MKQPTKYEITRDGEPVGKIERRGDLWIGTPAGVMMIYERASLMDCIEATIEAYEAQAREAARARRAMPD